VAFRSLSFAVFDDSLDQDEEGRFCRFEDPFRPRFYAQGRKAIFLISSTLSREAAAAGYQWTRKKEFWSGDEVEVIEIEVVDSEHYAQLPEAPSMGREITFYNCDIPCLRLIFTRKNFSNRPMYD